MLEISKTADQGLVALLEISQRGPISASHLARSIGFNRTLVHRLLQTLQHRGFVMHSEAGYVASPLLVELAGRVMPHLRASSRAAMSQLARDCGETVVLQVADVVDAVVVERVVTGRSPVRVEPPLGSRHPLCEGAAGAALLAYLPEREIARIADRLPSPSSLQRRVARVRVEGIAVSRNEYGAGVHAVAVPVLAPDGRPLAALSIVVPPPRALDVASLARALLAAAAELSKPLSQTGPEPPLATLAAQSGPSA